MNSTISSLVLAAPAKINLGLEVLYRRPDGYHELNTIFAALTLSDTVRLHAAAEQVTCRVIGEDELPCDHRNLAVQAALMMRERLGVDYGVAIELDKRVPVGAGLGGGSSDAAAVLLGLPRLWNLRPAPEVLRDMALQLGSDVPFFLQGGVALAGSRGERLRQLDVPLPWSVLLVNTGIHVATARAYGALGRIEPREASDLAAALVEGIGNPEMLRKLIVNDFEPVVFERFPTLQHIKRDLYDSGAIFALMSGSGSTLFGLYPDEIRARAAQQRFAQHWTSVAGFVSIPLADKVLRGSRSLAA